MSIEIITPVDEATKIPLLIAPPENQTEWLQTGLLTEHHAYHPHRTPRLEESIGARALRNSRMQTTPARFHNGGQGCYHRYFVGPPLPDAGDIEAQMKQVVLNVAGFIPRQIIDLNTGKPVIRDIKPEELKFFQHPGKPKQPTAKEFRVYCRLTGLSPNNAWRQLTLHNKARARLGYESIRYSDMPIREFFEDYLLRPEMIDVNPRTIKRFLTTKDETVLTHMADTILGRAISVATSNFLVDYQTVHGLGLVNPILPDTPDVAIKFQLGSFRRRRLVLAPKLGQLLELMAQNAA